MSHVNRTPVAAQIAQPPVVKNGRPHQVHNRKVPIQGSPVHTQPPTQPGEHLKLNSPIAQGSSKAVVVLYDNSFQDDHPYQDDQFNFEEALNYLGDIESMVMEKNSDGTYDRNSGIYTQEQARDLVMTAINTQIIPSATLTGLDKLELILSQTRLVDHNIALDNNGSYMKFGGTLNRLEGQHLINEMVNHLSSHDLYDAQALLDTLQELKVQHNDFSSGLFLDHNANALSKQILQKVIEDKGHLNPGEKLNIIRSQIMPYQPNIGYDQKQGSLTPQEAQEFMNKLLPNSGVYPSQPHATPAPVNLSSAKAQINMIKSQTKQYQHGYGYSQSPGLYTPEEANKRINNVLKESIIPSPYMSLQDKLNLIKEAQMAKQVDGQFDPHSGSLKPREAKRLVKQAVEQNHTFDAYGNSDINAIKNMIMTHQNGFGYDKSSGLLTHKEANQQIKALLVKITNSPYLTPEDKMNLIQEHTMQYRQGYGLDGTTGSLTPEEAQSIIDKVLNYSPDQDSKGAAPNKQPGFEEVFPQYKEPRIYYPDNKRDNSDYEFQRREAETAYDFFHGLF